MKTTNKTMLLLAIFLFVSFNVKAQTQVVKANPFGLLFGISNLNYEVAFKNNQSISLSGSYFKTKDYEDVSDLVAVGANISYNYYPLSARNAPRGLYVSPGIGMFSVSDGLNKVSVVTFTGTAGYQWIVWKHFAIDIFGQYIYFTKDSFPDLGRNLIAPGIGLGYAW